MRLAVATWVSLALVACTDATKQVTQFDDLYGDAEEHHEEGGGGGGGAYGAAAYHAPEPAYHAPEPAYHAPEPAYHAPEPAYHAPEPAYHAPEPAYHEPAPAYEPPYEQKEEYEEPSGEYDKVPYEAEPAAYVPAAVPEVLYVEPCKNNADCGQGICDIHYKCRCMDFWWTPNPKKHIKGRHFNPKAHRQHGEDRRLGGGFRLGEDEEDRSLFEDDLSLPTGPLVQPCSQKRKSQAEAFLLQLFLGVFGMGCFYLGEGWTGMAWCNLIFGCFPLFVCLAHCLCFGVFRCCVAPIASCMAKICCCIPGINAFDPDNLLDQTEEEFNELMCMNCCYCMASITALVLWIISLVMITNDCITGPGIPCVPW